MEQPSWGENLLRRQVMALLPPSQGVQFNVRPDWLVNPKTGYRLELDIYLPGLKLAFEYNGWQHYKIGADKMQEQWQRDRAKYRICHERGVRLKTFTASDLRADRSLRSIITALIGGEPIAYKESKMPLYKAAGLLRHDWGRKRMPGTPPAGWNGAGLHRVPTTNVRFERWKILADKAEERLKYWRKAPAMSSVPQTP